MIIEVPYDADAALALADLAAGLAGHGRAGRPSPLASALVLAGRATSSMRNRLERFPAGTALVQESLRHASRGVFAHDGVVAARVEFDDSVARAPVLLAAFEQPSAGASATLTAGLRLADAASLAGPGPDARARLGGATRLRTAPLAPAVVAGYLAAVGDPNPIHADRDRARALGLTGPVAPGGLIALLAEAAARALDFPSGATVYSGRFLSPALVGEPLELAVAPRPSSGEAAEARVLVMTPGLRLVAVLDLRAESARG
ncbi:hypothetical protein SLNSH_04285 [Alsobacter soli]|uniref:MaoC-like domain-containing protein n=1 Tax=Alsobacter soli TaxID=2109933 RepID=A0A2T1HXS7_9HYPH|nr:MaoC family dehydratase [Alsobacter soli]PSC06502.1 hypothetical protein SLNSH_04285 [Alsobacter soli]